MKLRLAPEWATEGLEKFGKNYLGQPHFRVIWGPSRWVVMGKFWEDLGRHAYLKVRKYGRDPKWILERWRPAAIYGFPELWNRPKSEGGCADEMGYLAAGPFPVHGEYECICPFSTGRGEAGFVPLEPGLIELSARACWMGRVATYSDIRRCLEDEALRKEREQDQRLDDLWDEKQLTRQGLSIGAGGAFNKQQEVDDYVRKLERKKPFVDARKFKPGFRQI